MKYKPFYLDNMEVKVPVVQGGMGIGISLSGLAGAVAKAGGIGIISAAQIGFREPDFDQNPLEANLRALKKEYEKARNIAPQGVIGFNIMVAMRHYEKYVAAAVEAGADIIVSGAGLPTDLPRIVKETEENIKNRESRTRLAPIVSTDRSAKVLLKYWDKKYGIVPDLVVIEGPNAGGHLGFTKEQIYQYEDRAEDYAQEIKRILQTVAEYGTRYGKKIPVAVGGGICTREQAEYAFSLGVDAIQVATRFVTTEECDADVRYKQAYIRAKEEDIVIVKSPVGMPGRAIKNRFMERVLAGEHIPHTPCHGCLHKCNPAEIPYCITDALIHAARGETEEALLFCGAYAYRADKVETVQEVIDSLL